MGEGQTGPVYSEVSRKDQSEPTGDSSTAGVQNGTAEKSIAKEVRKTSACLSCLGSCELFVL